MKIRLFNFLTRRAVAGVWLLGFGWRVLANPTGMTVAAGTAPPPVTSGSQLTITAGNNAFLNWQNFDIAAGETTVFQQPSATSIVWNRINGPNPSQIYGTLQANGVVVLMNSSGFYFGPNSFVSAAGLVVSTANCIPPQNSGGAWEFNGPPPIKSIINYGQIQVGQNGSAFLIAADVENHGSISAPGGSVGLAAGQTVLLSERPDGRGMSMQVTLPQGSVNNYGTLTADGGTIAMNAQVVNQNGLIQANSVSDQNGVIELVASDQLNLGANSQITAKGDNSADGSSGGSVTLKSGNDFSDNVGSQIDVSGGANGGNGGNVEISAPNVLSLNSSIDARAQTGWLAGKLLLDPDYIILDTSGAGSAGSGAVLAGNNPGTTLDLNVNTAFANLAVSQIILQAVYNITIASSTSWNLSSTIGANSGGVTSGQLTLEAGGDITFGNGSQITDANNWSVTLDAGYNFANHTTQSGQGNIYLNGGSGQSGNGSIQLSQGSINLTAGNSLVVGTGDQLVADGGAIRLYAQTVDQDGLIQANSVGNQYGIIELAASDSIALGANSQITANGDNSSPGSAGGQIMVQSAHTFSDVSGSQIEARGGANGGNGGRILIYPDTTQSSVNSTLDVSARAGSTMGSINYYPIIVGNLTLTASSLSPFTDFSHILFQAEGSIKLNANTTWDLSASSGLTGGLMTLEAGNNIIFQDGSAISDANNWSVSLFAGVDFASPTLRVVPVPAGNTDPTINHSIYLNGGEGLQGGGSIQTTAGSINLIAGQNIEAGAGSLTDFNFNQFSIGAAEGSVGLTAGKDIQIGSGYVETTDGGTISLSASSGSVIDSGAVQTDVASINNPVSISVLAGQDVLLNGGSASITTLGGGDIDVTAVAGSVNTGTDQNGFIFSPAGYMVNIYSLGGISTASGGNVNIIAGLDIVSFLPAGNNTAGDAGSGAFGIGASGNVTLTAGRNIVGHYVVADGTGTITAGNDAGTGSSQLALSLISGGWLVNAAHDINLQEVRNPNGILNGINRSFSAYHLFDYAPDDFVSLDAGNSVQLLGVNPPRNSSENIPSIYPPTLNITAGAGGVIIGNEVVLFPSPLGSLTINTTGGGSLETPSYVEYLQELVDYNPSSGNPPPSPPSDQVELVMSDSGSSQYTSTASFGAADYAAVPNHLNSPTPVALNISGDLNDFYLVVPEAAQINVVGDMNNCSFKGQNLSSDPDQNLQVQVREADGSLGMATVDPGMTSINVGQTAKENMENGGLLDPATDSGLYVGGNILNLNQYNTVPVSSAPDLSLLLQAFAASYSDLFNSLYFDPVPTPDDPNGGLLTLKGVLGQIGYNALTSLVIEEFDPSTGLIVANPNPVQILDPATAALLESESQNAPATPNPGYVLGGGGAFNITAHSLDLGSTLGIQTVGPADNPALHNYYVSTLPGYITHGAAINVNLSGDLDMFATTISSLNGGNISVNAAGDVIVGSTYVPGNDQYARGIYSTVDSDVSVIAGDNIEVAGSRIAAYDGGNVTVESLHGNVDAGNGGNGSVTVNEYYVDPVTGIIESGNPTIPLSGILAMTFPPRDPSSTEPQFGVGNILVEAPQGNITADAAGIVQLPLNGADSSAATVTVEAGSRDADGNVLYVGNIDTKGAGVIGSTVKLDATGNIIGLVFARNNADINAQQNADVTVLAEGTANVSAGGNVSGTIIGVGGISASGSSIDASLLSQNISSGVETSGEKGFAQGTTANSTSQGLANNDSTKAAASSDQSDDDDKKKKKEVALAQKVGRVTVILPARSPAPASSQKQTATQPL